MFGVLLLPVVVVETALVVVKVLQVPHRRPPVLHQIVLILRVQCPEALWRHFADGIEVDAQVGHAPLGELMGVVELGDDDQKMLQGFAFPLTSLPLYLNWLQKFQALLRSIRCLVLR